MSQYNSSVQNLFLGLVRRKRIPVEVALNTGTCFRGKIRAYDQFSITLAFRDKVEVIYKSTILFITALPRPAGRRPPPRGDRGPRPAGPPRPGLARPMGSRPMSPSRPLASRPAPLEVPPPRSPVAAPVTSRVTLLRTGEPKPPTPAATDLDDDPPPPRRPPPSRRPV